MAKELWPDGVKVARDGESPWKPEPPKREIPVMPAEQQLESARRQLEWNTRDLEDATWAIHPEDLLQLRSVIGTAVRLHGLFFTIVADPELEAMGPRLVWGDEWPESWL